MQAVKGWLKEKTLMMAALVREFACTASIARRAATDVSRRDAIYRIQQFDLAIDRAEEGMTLDRKGLAISAIACAFRSAVLADLAELDADAMQMLMDSVASRDLSTAIIHLDSIMDSAGFAGGHNRDENKVINIFRSQHTNRGFIS